MLLVIEALFVLTVAVGVWLTFGMGPALIVGGVLGVIATERTTARRPATSGERR